MLTMCGTLKLLKYNANKQVFFLITENMQSIEKKFVNAILQREPCYFGFFSSSFFFVN